MIHDWWVAHRLELYVGFSLLVLAGLLGLVRLWLLQREGKPAKEALSRTNDFLGEIVWDYKLDRITDFGETFVESNGRVYRTYCFWVDFDGESHRLDIDPRELAIAVFPQIFIRSRIAQLVSGKRDS